MRRATPTNPGPMARTAFRATPLAVAERAGSGVERRGAEPLETWTRSALLNTDEAAALLLVSRRTVQNWTRDGVIPSVKLGRRRMYLRRALQAHLQALSDASIAQPMVVRIALEPSNCVAPVLDSGAGEGPSRRPCTRDHRRGNGPRL